MIDKITIVTNNNVTIQHIKAHPLFNLSHESDNKFRGHYKNLLITKRTNSLTIEGSLTKFGYGTNAFNADRHTTNKFLKKLLNDLKIDPSAPVSYLEFGFSIPVFQKPILYLNALKDAKGYSKILITKNKGVKFINSTKYMHVYDKTEHFNENKHLLGKPFNHNIDLVRYEVALRNPEKVLKLESLMLIGQLLNSNLIDKLILFWCVEFNKIIKEKQVVPNFSINTPADVKNHLILKGIEAYGGVSAFLNEIASFNLSNHKNEYRKRIRDMVLSLSDDCKLSKNIIPANELEEKIKFIAMQHLNQPV